MVNASLFDHTPVVVLFLGTVMLLLAGSEIGCRLGLWHHRRMTEGEKAPTNTMMGSMLGLLAFMLAFTFNMSSTRFDTSKQLAQDEAIAILKTYQSAQFLPEPQRNASSELLREYLDLRVQAPKVSLEELPALLTRSDRIQDALWAQAASLADQPSAVLAGFMQSLSRLTELQIQRVRSVVWNRIPTSIIVMLYTIAVLGLAALGFSGGLTASRTTIPAAVLFSRSRP